MKRWRHSPAAARRAAHRYRWAPTWRAWSLSVLCVFLSACQLDGPVAEVYLGRGYEYKDLARLEKIFSLSGFRYEIQERRSTESAVESVYPWRFESGGTIYSYFNYSPDGADRLRAILSFKGTSGGLIVRIGGGDNCPSKGFSREAGKRIEELPPRIKSEFGKNVKIKYIDSERCAVSPKLAKDNFAKNHNKPLQPIAREDARSG